MQYEPKLAEPEIWFWQSIVTPHMAALAVQMARLNFRVTYVSQQVLSQDRIDLGWISPEMPGVDCKLALKDVDVRMLSKNAPVRSVHISQGIRANGVISIAQHELKNRGLFQFLIMESVNDLGVLGRLRRLEYRRRLSAKTKFFDAVLAIGYKTADWIADRGVDRSRIYDFAYFLPNPNLTAHKRRSDSKFKFIYVGQLIARKRVDLIIRALARLKNFNFEFLCVGNGSAETELVNLARSLLGARITWLGKRTIAEIPILIAEADCLILASKHDGWGAVVSEALMVGTPVVCSSACGAAGAVKASGFGSIFPSDDLNELTLALRHQMQTGQVDCESRTLLQQWSRRLDSESGALYLKEIISREIDSNDQDDLTSKAKKMNFYMRAPQ